MRRIFRSVIYALFYIELFLLAGIFGLDHVLAWGTIGMYLLIDIPIFFLASKERTRKVLEKHDKPMDELMWFTVATPVIMIFERKQNEIGNILGVLLVWPLVLVHQPLFLLHLTFMRRKILGRW